MVAINMFRGAFEARFTGRNGLPSTGVSPEDLIC